MEQCTDCRSEAGITVGLIDSVITIARVLRHRDLSVPEVVEALRDLATDEDIAAVLRSGTVSMANQPPNPNVHRINHALGTSPATKAGMQLDEALRAVLHEAVSALEFYGNLTYSHTMRLPPEVQWKAEDALDKIRPVVRALEHTS